MDTKEKPIQSVLKQNNTAPSTGSEGGNEGGNNSSSSLDGTNSSLNASQQNPMSYERDLWDCMAILNDNTWLKLNFIKNMRTFFNSYKKALEAFALQMQKANSQFEKDFIKNSVAYGVGDQGTYQQQPPQLIDTLTQSMSRIKFSMDSLHKQISSRVEAVEKDLVDSLDMFHKHYKQENHENLKEGTLFWNSIHTERTQMLFAKENYYNQMANLQQILQSYPAQGTGPIEESPYFQHQLANDKKFWQQYQRQETAKSEYERALAQLNMTIDLRFEQDYLPVLKHLQANDEGMLQFMRHTLDKFTKYVDLPGKDLCGHAFNRNQSPEDEGIPLPTLQNAIDSINPEHDIKVFIANNRTGNPTLVREEFQHAPEIVLHGHSLKLETLLMIKNTLVPAAQLPKQRKTSSEIGENRIQKALKSAWGGPLGEQDELEEAERVRQEAQDELLSQRLIMRDQLHMLLRGSQSITDQDKAVLTQQLESNTAFHESLCDVLNEVSSGKQLENHDCFLALGDVIQVTLTSMVRNYNEETKSTAPEELPFFDYKLLYTILESSQNIYTLISQKRKQYLWALLADHVIWRAPFHWEQCAIEIVQMKIDEAKKRQAIKSSTQNNNTSVEEDPLPSTPSGSQKGGFFKKGFSSLKGLLSSNKSQSAQSQQSQTNVELKYQQNLVFNELSRFVTHFINFGLPYQQANTLLITVCEHFQLEQSRMHLLLTELISNQKRTRSMFTEKEQLLWSLEKRGRRLKQFGVSDTMLVLGMTIKFINDDIKLRQLLLLGRDFNETLRQPVYKQALLRSSQHRLKDKRCALWMRILQLPFNNEEQIRQDYFMYRRRADNPQYLPKVVSDAIEVDVARSFNHMKDVTGANLNNILKAYATVNSTQLDYCQGMNFIAGFLFMLFDQKEEYAFAVLKEVITRFHMQDLFDTQLPLLKLNFYQLDRLISLLLPDLHSHFKDEAINSSYFSAPYFITIFTSTLQLQLNLDNASPLSRLWDYFIVYGWKAIFRVSLAVLKDFEEQLLGMPFEVLLTQIVNLPQKFLLKEDPLAADTFDKKYHEIKMPTMLLDRLKKEFDENFEVSKRSQSVAQSNNAFQFDEQIANASQSNATVVGSQANMGISPQAQVPMKSTESKFRSFFSKKDKSGQE